MDFDDAGEMPEELLVFYHPDTLRQISALRRHLRARERSRTLSAADCWIRMVAVNRLTGHSTGFFSVYTLPPNQAVSVRAQAKINSRLEQTPAAARRAEDRSEEEPVAAARRHAGAARAARCWSD